MFRASVCMKIRISFPSFCCITFVVISPESALCLRLKELLITRIETPNQVMAKALLDVALLNPLLIQVLDELLPFHPVDERTDVTAVSEEGSARQVERASCRGDGQEKKIWGWAGGEEWWTMAKQTAQVVFPSCEKHNFNGSHFTQQVHWTPGILFKQQLWEP